MLVRVQTETAIFVPVWQVHKRTPAAVSQNVQRAIAEQAIEIVRIGFWVTGKVFTIPVAEIREMFSVKIFFHSFSPFLPCIQMSEQNLISNLARGTGKCLLRKPNPALNLRKRRFELSNNKAAPHGNSQ